MKNRIVVCLLLVFLFPLLSQGQGKQACQFNIEGSVQQPSCQGGMDGAIRLQVSGGAAPYTYRWHTGQESAAIDQLSTGIYRVTVMDREGCTSTGEFSISDQVKDLGLQIEQQSTASGKKILKVKFSGNSKPAAIYIKDMSKGYSAPRVAYHGEALNSGVYMLEVFTEVGCSVSERIKIEAN